MERRLKQLAAGLLLLLTLCPCAPRADAALTALTIEQVRAKQPQIYVYCYDNTGVLDSNFEAGCYLDGTQLSWAGIQESTRYGTAYTILLDISGSIRQSYMDEVLQQIRTLASRLKPKDSITIITFGNDVETLISNCTDVNKIETALAEIQCTDQQTHLYEAVNDAILCAAAADGQSRRIMLVVSDGIQESDQGGVTPTEIESQLKSAGIPVFALCVDYADDEAKEQFGVFARATGGTRQSFNVDTIEIVWDDLLQQFESGKILCFESTNNFADGAEHTLLLKLSADGVEESYTRKVELKDWQLDRTAPQIEHAAYDAESNAFLVRFSEEVQGAELPENYCIEAPDGKYLTVSSVIRDGEEYIVSLAQQPKKGTYLLTIFDVTDCSMEQNALPEDAFSVTVVPQKQPNRVFILWAGIVAALLAGLAVILLLLRRKKRAEQQEKTPEKVEYEVHHVIMTGGNGAQTTPLAAQSGAAAQIGLYQVGPNGLSQHLEILVVKSSILGRSTAMCDICLPDKKISGQHCAFSVSGGKVYLSDLDSQNGTYLNGIRVTQPMHVHNGDVVRLGDTDLRIESLAVQQENLL